MRGKKAVIGRAMTLIPTILFVILVMIIFGIYSAAVGSTKEGISGPNTLYEIDGSSLFFKNINISGESRVILYSMVKEYYPKKSDFSNEFKSAVYKFVRSDNQFIGKESCILLTIGDYSNMNKEILVDPSNNKYSLYLIKGEDEKIVTRYEAEHKEGIRKVDENVYKHISESKIVIDDKEVSVFSYYGECK